MNDTDEQHRRRIRSFVRREGRLTRAQQHALETLWPVYGIDAGETVSPGGLFGRDAPLTLEIGFGNGDTLLAMARAEPSTDFIGIEVHRPGVGRLLHELDRQQLTNVRVMREDAMEILENDLPDACLDRVLLFFPDPWHKKKHHKRRIVQPHFMQLVARKLKAGGILHMATDWQDYAEHMLAVADASDAFVNTAGAGNFAERPDYRPVTKFEQRGRRLGHGVWDLVYRRTN